MSIITATINQIKEGKYFESQNKYNSENELKEVFNKAYNQVIESGVNPERIKCIAVDECGNCVAYRRLAIDDLDLLVLVFNINGRVDCAQKGEESWF